MPFRVSLLSLLLLFAAPGFAGVVFEFEILDVAAEGEPPDVINTVVDGENIRMDVKGPRGANADMIFRGASQEMLAVDHDSRTYVLLDSTSIGQIGEQLSVLEAQLQEMLKDVPPEQRAAVEEMLADQMPQPGDAEPDIELRETGQTGEQNGYPAVKYQLYRDGRLEKDFWITDWENIEGGREAAGAFESLAVFIKGLQDAMPDFAKSPAVGSHAYEHLDELDGFPIVTIDYADDGTVLGENRFTGSRIAAVDADEFEPPADYAEQSIAPKIGVQ